MGMPDLFTNASSIKLRLMKQFYGIEEYMDLPQSLPKVLDQLDEVKSEFEFLNALTNLDIWHIKVSNSEDKKTWNPFTEVLADYANRYTLLNAHLYAEKQWPNSKIIEYAKQSAN